MAQNSEKAKTTIESFLFKRTRASTVAPDWEKRRDELARGDWVKQPLPGELKRKRVEMGEPENPWSQSRNLSVGFVATIELHLQFSPRVASVEQSASSDNRANHLFFIDWKTVDTIFFYWFALKMMSQVQAMKKQVTQLRQEASVQRIQVSQACEE